MAVADLETGTDRVRPATGRPGGVYEQRKGRARFRAASGALSWARRSGLSRRAGPDRGEQRQQSPARSSARSLLAHYGLLVSEGPGLRRCWGFLSGGGGCLSTPPPTGFPVYRPPWTCGSEGVDPNPPPADCPPWPWQGHKGLPKPRLEPACRPDWLE